MVAFLGGQFENVGRQFDPKCGAAVAGSVERQEATMRLDEIAGDCQAEAGARRFGA